MVKRRTVNSEIPGSNPASGNYLFNCAMLQRGTSGMVYLIHTQWYIRTEYPVYRVANFVDVELYAKGHKRIAKHAVDGLKVKSQ